MSNWTDKDFETYTQSDWELIKSVKELTDINLGNPAVLESANEIALAVFGMLCVRLHEKGGEGVDGLGMALQEYTDTVLGYSKGGENDGWADEYAKPIDQFIRFGKKKFNKKSQNNKNTPITLVCSLLCTTKIYN